MRPLSLYLVVISVLFVWQAATQAVVFSTDTYISPTDYMYDGQDIIVDGCILTIDGEHNFNNLQINNTGTIRHSAAPSGQPDNNVHLIIAQHLTIFSGGQITADGLGYGGNDGPGAGGSDYAGGGGGYGGPGGRGKYWYESIGGPWIYRYADGGVSYGSLTEPTDIGSGGGNSGSSGGGAIHLEVGGTLQVDGNITANGNPGYRDSGGGSGGSIWLTVGSLIGNGTIASNGGNGDYYNSATRTHRYSGGGGGGRIAVYYVSDAFTGTITAYGGTQYYYSGGNGGAGTIYTKANNSEADLLIDNDDHGASATVISGVSIWNQVSVQNQGNIDVNEPDLIVEEIIINNGTANLRNDRQYIHNLTINDGAASLSGIEQSISDILVNGGTVTLSGVEQSIGDLEVNGGTVYISEDATVDDVYIDVGSVLTAGNGKDFVLSVSGNMILEGVAKPAVSHCFNLNISGNLVIHNGGQITADGLGYGGNDGPGAGGSDYAGGGGGYGGPGGRGKYWYESIGGPWIYRYADGGVSYGSLTEPTDIGSGGGNSGSSGGGAIHLEVGGTLQVDGNITANGNPGYRDSGGGSGGSIWLTVGSLIGNGTIASNGGNGDYYNSATRTHRYSGGGGGGRIAVYYVSDAFTGTITAYGGTQYYYSGGNGGAGTIYLQEGLVDQLAGTVRDAINGNPIDGVNVNVFGRTVLTNPQGEFSFVGLGSGDVTLYATKTGYYDVSQVFYLQGNANQHLDIRMTPESAGTNLSAVEIRGKYCGPGNHAYYLDGVTHNETFTTTVDWKGYTPGTVRWITPSGTSEDSSPASQVAQVSRSFDMGNEFGIGGKLTVVAIAGDSTQSAPKQANFSVISPPPGIPSVALAANITSTILLYNAEWILDAVEEGVDAGIIDEDMPVFGGEAFYFGIKPLLTAKITGDGSATATLVDGYDLPDMDIAGIGISSSVSVEFGWNYRSEQAKWLPTGAITVWVSGRYETPPFYIWHIPPVYWQGYVEGELDGAKLAITDWDDGSPIWEGTIPFYVGAGLEVGVGLADVLSAEGYLGGGADMLIVFPSEDPLQKLTIVLEGGVNIDVWVKEWKKDLLRYEWDLVDGKETGILSGPMMLDALEEVKAGDFRTMPRDYLGRDYGLWLPVVQQAQPQGLMTLESDAPVPCEPDIEQLLQYKVFGQSQPTIAAHGNDLLLAWVYDDPNRDPSDPNSLNRTEIVFSECREGLWTEPVAIDNDGTADFSPQLVTLPDGSVICVWENARQWLPDDANLTEMAATMEILAAHYDRASGTWTAQTLTDNGHLDRTPRIASAADGTAIAVWIENEENDILGLDPNAANVIRYSLWDGASWTEPNTAAEGIGLMVKTSLAYNASEAVYVCSLDIDGDWQTEMDQELYAVVYDGNDWSEPCRLTEDMLLDANPQVMYDQNDLLLVWYRDANLVSLRNFDPNSLDEVLRASGSSGSMDFRLAKSPAGQISLVWTETSTAGVDIFTATYDAGLLIWSKAYQLISDRAMERSVSAAYAGADELALAYNKVEIIDQNGIPEPNRVDLYVLRHSISTDLAIPPGGVAVATYTSIKPGEPVDLTADIVNTGDVAVKDVQVAFCEGRPDANGTLIDEMQIIEGPIPAGASATASVSWIVPEVNEPLEIYVVVDPCFVLEDSDRSNNVASISLLGADLTVTSISSERIGPKKRGITARVANVGGLSAGNVTVMLNKGSATGPELASYNIDELAPEAFHDLWYIWDIAAEDLNDVELSVHVDVDWSDEIVETNEENNTAIGLIQVGKAADVTDNGRIDFVDCARFADSWLEDCSGPEWCEGRDFDKSSKVDFGDVKDLAESWLWQAGWYNE